MKSNELVTYIKKGYLDNILMNLYELPSNTSPAFLAQKNRYISLIENFIALYDKNGDRDVSLFSVSGRSELSGNHTDHNFGKVIAASIDLDVIAVAAIRKDSIIRVKSEGFAENYVDYLLYREPDAKKYTISDSLIAGMCRSFGDKGYTIGGFDAYTSSNVLKGSGLSSSAAFEDMIGTILNHLYNNGTVAATEIAKSAQFAENEFFGKPCGLMDQMACAVGGIISIDFAEPLAPIVEKIDFDFSAAGYNLCIVDTGGNHADLGDDYASIPLEMKAIASYFGKKVLRNVGYDELVASISELRKVTGDRAILRALHYIAENERVELQKRALSEGRLDTFFEIVLESGRSSFCYLQNVYTVKNLNEQGLSLALCLADGYLKNKKAAWRVHGGGFAGTIQAYVPKDDVDDFRTLMSSVFGENSCIVLKVRRLGATKLI